MDFDYHHDFYYGQGYGYPSSQGMSDTMFHAVLAIVMIIITVGMIIKLSAYVIHSYGLYRIAKRLNINHAWMAFVPYARDYLYGEVSGEIALKNKVIKKPGIWRLLLPVGAGLIFSTLGSVTWVLLRMGVALSEALGAVGGSLVLSAVALLVVIGVLNILYLAGYKVLCVLMDMKIYSRFTERNMPVIHALLSAFVPFYGAVCMMVMCGRSFVAGQPEFGHTGTAEPERNQPESSQTGTVEPETEAERNQPEFDQAGTAEPETEAERNQSEFCQAGTAEPEAEPERNQLEFDQTGTVESEREPERNQPEFDQTGSLDPETK